MAIAMPAVRNLVSKYEKDRIQHLYVNAAVQEMVERIRRYMEQKRNIPASVLRRDKGITNRTRIVVFAVEEWFRDIEQGDALPVEVIRGYLRTYMEQVDLGESRKTSVETEPEVRSQIVAIVEYLKKQNYPIPYLRGKRRWPPLLIVMMAIIRLNDQIQREYPDL